MMKDGIWRYYGWSAELWYATEQKKNNKKKREDSIISQYSTTSKAEHTVVPIALRSIVVVVIFEIPILPAINEINNRK